jgi:riboflavin biosynthesis pyrimidine reductase
LARAFEEFERRKTAEAAAARIEPWRTVLERPLPELIAIGNDWSRARFGGDFFLSPLPRRLPSTSLVFVESREGNTVAKNPSSLGGGETDKHLVYEGLSRVAADAVMAGAETIRGGRIVFSIWHPELVALRESLRLPRHPAQIVATLRGMPLDDGLLFNEPRLQVIVLTVPGCADLMARSLEARPWIRVVTMHDPADLPAAFHALRGLGVTRISCVGGRTLARQLIDAGLVQDLYLTKSPRSGGEPDTPLYPGHLDGAIVVQKAGTGSDGGVTFEQRILSDGPSP